MDTQLVRRTVGEVRSVWRNATPGAATRWVASLAVHLPECARSRSLVPADRTWAHRGARFRTPSGAVVSLPAAYTAGAREMYCRNVYLRTGLTMPTEGWVVDLGANNGLFAVWAAVTGARVIAVEAQQDFADKIRRLAEYNNVADRIAVEIALASGVASSGAHVGVVADDLRWAATSHGAAARPADVSMPELMSTYRIDRVGLLKVDIEGGEFAVLADAEDLSWLQRVDQLALEVHRGFGDTAALIERLRSHGFTIDLCDNDGRHTASASDHPDYAYCRRP
jgi:FkbM family methyltransferase